MRGDPMFCSKCGSEPTEGANEGPATGMMMLLTLAITAVVAVVVTGCSFGFDRSSSTSEPSSVGLGLASTTSAEDAGAGDSGLATTTTSEAVFTGNDFWLRVRATGDCFLVVRDDNENGDILYRQTIGAGEEFNYTESKRYWVHIADPEVVRVYVNDAQIITETGIARVE
jgi:hypothetical protein